MACYCKVRQLLVTIKFEVLAQIGRLKPDIQIILQSWPKGFGRHFLFHMFLLVWNLQLTDKTPSNRLTNAPPTPPPPPPIKVEFDNLFKLCKRRLDSNTQHCSGGRGLSLPRWRFEGSSYFVPPLGRDETRAPLKHQRWRLEGA